MKFFTSYVDFIFIEVFVGLIVGPILFSEQSRTLAMALRKFFQTFLPPLWETFWGRFKADGTMSHILIEGPY